MTVYQFSPHQLRSNLPVYWSCNIWRGRHSAHATARSPQAAYRLALGLLAAMGEG